MWSRFLKGLCTILRNVDICGPLRFFAIFNNPCSFFFFLILFLVLASENGCLLDNLMERAGYFFVGLNLNSYIPRRCFSYADWPAHM